MNMCKALAVCAVMLATNCASADVLALNTGMDLTRYCNEKNSTEMNVAWIECLSTVDGILSGYGAGIYTTLYALKEKLTADDAEKYEAVIRNYCPDGKITFQQYGLVVSKYLSDHPEKLNEPDSAVVILAVQDAWPCPKAIQHKH